MPLISGAAAVLALQLGMPAVQNEMPEVVQVRGGWCSHGYDIDIYGRCYPNGVIPPQYQAARQHGGYGAYGRYGGRYQNDPRYYRRY